MTHQPTFSLTIQVAELAQALQDSKTHPQSAPWLIFDVSYDLANSEWGKEQFEQAHIAGARYVDLHTDLSTHDEHSAINGGRHPLPKREHFAKWISQQGITPETQVVVYDRNGMNFCARLWWMLKWCGHNKVAVLDGGLKAWRDSGGEIKAQSSEKSTVSSDLRVSPHASSSASSSASFNTSFELGPPLVQWRDQQFVLEHLESSDQTLIDARATPRFLGLQEPLDPIAGHIPGALNRPFTQNFDEQGFLKPAAQLKSEFEALLAGKDPSSVVHHCGSGVSAIPNILAMELAGLGPTALYAGSWSEWSRTPGLPVQTA